MLSRIYAKIKSSRIKSVLQYTSPANKPNLTGSVGQKKQIQRKAIPVRQQRLWKDVFVIHKSPSNNKVQNAIFSTKVTVRATKSLTLVYFEGFH